MLMELSYLRELNTASILLRLALAVLFGGVIGLERGTRHKAAGFRTYMMVCIGAVLTMLLGQYQSYMLETNWYDAMEIIGTKTDISRFSAQVINGVGFLGAGTIIVTGHQAVRGLTTAAALWASACMGLVIGAGYYECVFLSFILIFVCIRILNPIEKMLVERSKNINLYIEFESFDDVRSIVNYLKANQIHIYEIDLEHRRKDQHVYPGAVFTMRMGKKYSHTNLIAMLFSLEQIRMIEEV